MPTHFDAAHSFGFFVAGLPRPLAGAVFREVEAVSVVLQELVVTFKSKAGGLMGEPGAGAIAEVADIRGEAP
jgi:hypothetical protein